MDLQCILYFLTTIEAEMFHVFFFYFIFLIANGSYPLTIFVLLLVLFYTVTEKYPPPDYKMQMGID